MMRSTLLVVLLLTVIGIHAQDRFDWNGTYQLQLSDFRSSATEIGKTSIYSLRAGTSIDFSFYMSNAEFMFTKNFNSKVGNTFSRNASLLVAPDTATALNLLNFARYEFDLSELYARKFRKKLFEEKGAFSNVSFFQPIYQNIQNEFTERHTLAGKETDIGRDHDKLKVLHAEVLKEIEALSDFCKTCKPPKKKKK